VLSRSRAADSLAAMSGDRSSASVAAGRPCGTRRTRTRNDRRPELSACLGEHDHCVAAGERTTRRCISHAAISGPDRVLASARGRPAWCAHYRRDCASQWQASCLADRSLLPDEQSEASPPPVAVHVRQPGIAHPFELRFHLGQYVLRIATRSPNPAIELLVKLGGRTLDHFKVDEHASRAQRRHDLTEQ